MSDTLIPWVITGLVCLAAASASCVPLLVAQALPKAPRDIDDSWRDPPPLMFRLLRWFMPRLAHYVDEKLKPDKREALLGRLNEAGLSYAITPAEVMAARWLLVAITAIMVVYIVLTYQVFEWRYLVPVLISIPCAYFYMDFWLYDAAKRRKRCIEKDFPFFLDVVVLSMKAGLAFSAALQQATTQLPEGPIRQELARLIREVRTGITRSNGMERLAKRVRLASVSNFVAVVAQAEESGGSLTKSLNEQARQRRRERFLRAEKLANQAPVKMLFPLVALLFPVTFIILGFPVFEQISDSGLLNMGK